ncbi:MAG: hypothetical protein QOK35_238 [Pseudonocardiales bacterium]|nr:hypothetical protein [Pseudonocardiales bacterium]
MSRETTPTVTRTRPSTTDRAGPGATGTGFARGDFVLVAGDHFNSRLIRFGQRLRIHGADRVHVKWTHAALIVDADGGLIEAVGAGVRRWHLDRYRDHDYVVVHLETSEENRDEVVRFAEWALRRRARYSRLSTVSTALSMLTGSKLTFFIDGQFVCSGLVACALERTGDIFDRNAANIAPADLAKYFEVDRSAGRGDQADAVAGALSTARTSSARERMPSLR